MREINEEEKAMARRAIMMKIRQNSGRVTREGVKILMRDDDQGWMLSVFDATIADLLAKQIITENNNLLTWGNER